MSDIKPRPVNMDAKGKPFTNRELRQRAEHYQQQLTELQAEEVRWILKEALLEHTITTLKSENNDLVEENLKLSKQANFYRHKCKVYGQALDQDDTEQCSLLWERDTLKARIVELEADEKRVKGWYERAQRAEQRVTFLERAIRNDEDTIELRNHRIAGLRKDNEGLKERVKALEDIIRKERVVAYTFREKMEGMVKIATEALKGWYRNHSGVKCDHPNGLDDSGFCHVCGQSV